MQVNRSFSSSLLLLQGRGAASSEEPYSTTPFKAETGLIGAMITIYLNALLGTRYLLKGKSSEYGPNQMMSLSENFSSFHCLLRCQNGSSMALFLEVALSTQACPTDHAYEALGNDPKRDASA